MLRGGALSRETEWKPTSDSYFNTHFKPVLEVLNPDTLGYDGLKAVYFDMGDLGMLGDSNGNLTSAGVVYTGALTLPEITPENGFILTREQAGKLGWFDGSNYYAPGTTLNLSSGSVLTAAYYTGPGTAPVITTSSLAAGKVNSFYSQSLDATGDTPIIWSLEDGSLPPGLTLSEEGVISGTPARDGSFSFTVKAENSASIAKKVLLIKIESESPAWNGFSSIKGMKTNYSNIPDLVPKKRPDQPIIAEFSTIPTVDNNGHAVVTIPQQLVDAAIAKAQEEAEAQGKTGNGIGVSVKIDMPDTATSLGIVLPVETLNSLVNAGVSQLEIDGVIISLNFDLEALREVLKQSAGDVTLTVKPAQNLPVELKKFIEDRPVFDVTINYFRDGETVNITSLGAGSCNITIPYTPKQGEHAGQFAGLIVTDPAAILGGAIAGYFSLIDRAAVIYQYVDFLTDHFSIFGIAYIPPTEGYTDVEAHWAFDSIEYVMGRGLFAGTSAASFSPDMIMNRGMLATVLGRMAGADVSAYTASSFSDVAEGTYYLPYIEWAYKKGIIKDIENGRFDPERAVTREEIALILQNYARATGYILPATCEAIDFTDSTAISEAYREAVRAVQQAGIIEGDPNNRFNPKSGATRAEVATMLHRYIRLTIDLATAFGWAKYDDGRWFYYRDGKPLTGWQTVDGVRYFFGEDGTLQTGWVKDGDNWRYYVGNKAVVGWRDISSRTVTKRYYFDKNALMVSGGWFMIDGKWYYFFDDGQLASSEADKC